MLSGQHHTLKHALRTFLPNKIEIPSLAKLPNDIVKNRSLKSICGMNAKMFASLCQWWHDIARGFHTRHFKRTKFMNAEFVPAHWQPKIQFYCTQSSFICVNVKLRGTCIFLFYYFSFLLTFQCFAKDIFIVFLYLYYFLDFQWSI